MKATLRQLLRFLIALELVARREDDAPDPEAAELTAERLRILNNSAALRIYGPKLRPLGGELSGLPAPFLDDVDLNQALKDTDTTHDGYAKGGRLQTESYLALPDLATDVRTLVEGIQRDFVPDLALTRASLSTQARAAKERLAILETHRGALQSVPVIGGTLYEWIKRYLEAGALLETLLERRDLVRAAGHLDRSRIPVLRAELIGLLSRLRTALTDEVGEAAANLVFGPLDAAIARG